MPDDRCVCCGILFIAMSFLMNINDDRDDRNCFWGGGMYDLGSFVYGMFMVKERS
jgi:hypothetical protein